MKGVILAAGIRTRLYPPAKVTNRHAGDFTQLAQANQLLFSLNNTLKKGDE